MRRWEDLVGFFFKFQVSRVINNAIIAIPLLFIMGNLPPAIFWIKKEEKNEIWKNKCKNRLFNFQKKCSSFSIVWFISVRTGRKNNTRNRLTSQIDSFSCAFYHCNGIYLLDCWIYVALVWGADTYNHNIMINEQPTVPCVWLHTLG